jgi:hypothetical protein
MIGKRCYNPGLVLHMCKSIGLIEYLHEGRKNDIRSGLEHL